MAARTAAEKDQLETLAAEKESLKKRISAAQERIVVIEKMETALGGSIKSEGR